MIPNSSCKEHKNLFYVQYVALMLIILTVVIGAFLQGERANAKENTMPFYSVKTKEKIIFNEEKERQEFLDSIKTYSLIFKEHNLKGQIFIGFNKNSDQEDLNLFEKQIENAFKDNNINLKAIEIYFDESVSKDEVVFKIIRTNQYGLL